MEVHEKGRTTMNSDNKLMFFLGAVLSIGVVMLYIFRKALECIGGKCSASGK
ncbi:MAG: hypothetical protein PHV71_05230 [Eubacteriales bacterium]|nr:hypothetical protein [Eubacteriales bacterium]MDD3199753.1 hypothetical protein [Eubacteriales bacterium]MDD4121929.1 hypothetical protein [Eubacteriales bacterium]MDD4629993.1 hypothetical protein [Eubacteriales bacterium]